VLLNCPRFITEQQIIELNGKNLFFCEGRLRITLLCVKKYLPLKKY